MDIPKIQEQPAESGKKAYHHPNLRAAGSLKEQTKTGWGALSSDTAWTASVSQS